MTRKVALIGVLGLAGCGGGGSLMPLAVGRSATYLVGTGFDKRVEPIKVTRRISVANGPGFELGGPLGVSRLAWRGGGLYAGETANASFEPSLPILAEDLKPRKWHGRLRVLGREIPATAELTHKKDAKVDVGARTIKATLAAIIFRVPQGTIELDSWYQAGVGLVQQEQLTNGRMVVRLQMISPP